MQTVVIRDITSTDRLGISWRPRSNAALSASEGDEDRTRMTEFHEDCGNGGGVKRGYISSRFVAPVSQLRAPNALLSGIIDTL
jgi:hypothetical protein